MKVEKQESPTKREPFQSVTDSNPLGTGPPIPGCTLSHVDFVREDISAQDVQNVSLDIVKR